MGDDAPMVRDGDAPPRGSGFSGAECAEAQNEAIAVGTGEAEFGGAGSLSAGDGVVGVASVPPAGRVIEPGRGSSVPGFLMTAGIVVLTITVAARGRWFRRFLSKHGEKKRIEAHLSPPELNAAEARFVAEASRARLVDAEREARARQTLETLMVEVQELTRLCAGQIENRAVRLERLIAEADEKLAALREATTTKASASVGRGPAVATPTVATRSLRAARPASRSEAEVAAALPPEALRRSSVLTNNSSGQRSGEQAGQRTLDPLTRRVYEMADRGMNSLEIARKLEEQIGKIELILSLRR